MNARPEPFRFFWTRFRALLEAADLPALHELLDAADAAIADSREALLVHATPTEDGADRESVLRSFSTHQDLARFREDIERAVRIAGEFS
jgi:hypothetical protein